MTEVAASQSDMTVARRNTDETRSERQDQPVNRVWAILIDRLWNHTEEIGEMETQSFKGLL